MQNNCGGMKRVISYIVLAVMLFGVLFAEGADSPLAEVQVQVNKVLEILRDPALKGVAMKKRRQERIREISEKMFDFNELSKRTLAQHWNNFNDRQKKEFVEQFKSVLEAAYIDKIMSYSDEKVLFRKEVGLSEKTAEVQTVIVTKKNDVPINYRVIKTDSGWKVYDVVIEGVSLVNNYRSQFREILINNTPDSLINMLSKKALKHLK